MKGLLFVAVGALGFVAGLLVAGSDDGALRIDRPDGSGASILQGNGEDPGGSSTNPASNPGAGVLPEIRKTVEARPKSPRSQKALAAFVYRCRELGPAAVDGLKSFLLSGDDVTLNRIWRFQDGELESYPSLRSAYLEALASIDGEEATAALRDVFERSGSVEESYLIALSLASRGAAGWETTLLDRALVDDPPGHVMHVLPAMVELVAKADPTAAATYLYQRAPRGESGTDPRVLARGLVGLPLPAAVATTERLLADDTVTQRAKGRFVSTLLKARSEVEAMAAVRRAIARGTLPEPLVATLVNDAANAGSFFWDAQVYRTAQASGNNAAAEEARGRYLRRIAEVERMIVAAYGPNSNDRRAANARRKLETLRKNLDAN